MPSTDHKQAEIIKALTCGGYAHAENIFALIAKLDKQLPPEAVVEAVHSHIFPHF